MKTAIAFITAIWAVFLLDIIIPLDFNTMGLVPRSLTGLVGILTMPFLHGNLAHIMSNTVPIFILMMLVAGTCKRPAEEIVIELIFAGGLLLWLFGNKGTHIGASGLVYGLVTYLILAGWWSRDPKRAIVGILVAVFYGGLVWGILPTQPGVSWAGHLFGAIGGGGVAYTQFASGQIEKKAL